MSASLWLLSASIAVLVVSGLLWKQARRRDAASSHYAVFFEDASIHQKGDDLTLEIADRIFDAEDYRIVGRETPHFARRFLDERTVLALDWLREVRAQVRCSVREYRRVARADSRVKVRDEIEIAFEFLVFELTCGMVCCLVLAHGPSDAARLLRWLLESARKLREAAESITLNSDSVINAIPKNNS